MLLATDASAQCGEIPIGGGDPLACAPCGPTPTQFAGTTLGATASNQRSAWCDDFGTIDNDVYFAVTATAECGSVALTTTACYFGGYGLQLTLFDRLGDVAWVCDFTEIDLGQTAVRTGCNLTPGEVYFVGVDGWGGSECDFDVELLAGFYALTGGGVPGGGSVAYPDGLPATACSVTPIRTVAAAPGAAYVSYEFAGEVMATVQPGADTSITLGQTYAPGSCRTDTLRAFAQSCAAAPALLGAIELEVCGAPLVDNTRRVCGPAALTTTGTPAGTSFDTIALGPDPCDGVRIEGTYRDSSLIHRVVTRGQCDLDALAAASCDDALRASVGVLYCYDEDGGPGGCPRTTRYANPDSAMYAVALPSDTVAVYAAVDPTVPYPLDGYIISWTDAAGFLAGATPRLITNRFTSPGTYYLNLEPSGGGCERVVPIVVVLGANSAATSCPGLPGAAGGGDICLVCLRDGDVLLGTSRGQTASPRSVWCGGQGVVDNDQYFAVVADSTAITLSFIVEYCSAGTGLQVGVFTADGTAVPGGCGYDYAAPGELYSVVAQTQVGQTYYIGVDGWAGAQCDFLIADIRGAVLSDPNAPVPSAPRLALAGAQADTVCYDRFAGVDFEVSGIDAAATATTIVVETPSGRRATHAASSGLNEVDLFGVYSGVGCHDLRAWAYSGSGCVLSDPSDAVDFVLCTPYTFIRFVDSVVCVGSVAVPSTDTSRAAAEWTDAGGRPAGRSPNTFANAFDAPGTYTLTAVEGVCRVTRQLEVRPGAGPAIGYRTDGLTVTAWIENGPFDSWLWLVDGVFYGPADTITVEVAAVGTYRFELIDVEGGCLGLASVEQDVVVDGTSALGGASRVAGAVGGLRLSPKPASHTLSWRLEASAEPLATGPLTLTVVDALGRVAYRAAVGAGERSGRVDVSRWPAGTYVMRVATTRRRRGAPPGHWVGRFSVQ